MNAKNWPKHLTICKNRFNFIFNIQPWDLSTKIQKYKPLKIEGERFKIVVSNMQNSLSSCLDIKALQLV